MLKQNLLQTAQVSPTVQFIGSKVQTKLVPFQGATDTMQESKPAVVTLRSPLPWNS